MREIIVTGIGSRDLPEKQAVWIDEISEFMVANGCLLRSGGAPGTDKRFQKVYERLGGKKEIYIPWNGFEGLYDNGGDIILANHKDCEPYTMKYHPNPYALKIGAKKLMNRNAHQVLGYDLQSKSDLIIAYTENGWVKGGTAQALRMAMDIGIPIINLGAEPSSLNVIRKLKLFLIDI